jgi:hypothetical protein
LLFLLVPFIWQVGLARWANAVLWRPLGLPFQMTWQMAGVLISSLALAIIYRVDAARDDQDGAGGQQSPDGRDQP